MKGGGGSKGFKSPYVQDYENTLFGGLANRAGARRINPSEAEAPTALPATATQTPGFRNRMMSARTQPALQQKKPTSPMNQWDFSDVGKQVSTAQAKQGYDFSPIDKALEGYSKPKAYTETYNPNTFNFKSLPSTYGNMAYGARVGNLNREGADNLARVRETVGPRNVGALTRATQTVQRDTDQRRDALKQEQALQEMGMRADYDVQEQMANADEGYRGYQSRADVENKNQAQAFDYLKALESGGTNKIAAEAQLTEQERAYQDKVLEYLQQLYNTSSGATNQGANVNAGNRGNTLDFLGKMAGTAASFI